MLAVGLHHGTIIRSSFHSDEELSLTAAEQLCRWLADHGIPEPDASRRRILKR